jgi:hypothetical protein
MWDGVPMTSVAKWRAARRCNIILHTMFPTIRLSLAAFSSEQTFRHEWISAWMRFTWHVLLLSSHISHVRRARQGGGESLLQHHLTMTYPFLAIGRLVHLLPHNWSWREWVLAVGLMNGRVHRNHALLIEKTQFPHYEVYFVILTVTAPLWSSGSWLQIRRPGFDSWHYQKKK